MSNFFSLKYFRELSVLLVLECIIALLLFMIITINNLDVKYFNGISLGIALGSWCFCCILDREKYFNLATLIGTGSATYFIFWFLFSLSGIK